MRPGISIQHGLLPARNTGMVRCDIGAIIGFIPRDLWPEDATGGDFLEMRLRRWQELEEHPQRHLVEPAGVSGGKDQNLEGPHGPEGHERDKGVVRAH